MAQSAERSPLLLSGKAGRRFAAIYRQHNPDQSALPVSHSICASAKPQAQLQQHSTRVVVLDEPVFSLPQQPHSQLPSTQSWQAKRDIHAEIYLTCNTLRTLSLVNGSFAQVTCCLLSVIECMHSG